MDTINQNFVNNFERDLFANNIFQSCSNESDKEIVNYRPLLKSNEVFHEDVKIIDHLPDIRTVLVDSGVIDIENIARTTVKDLKKKGFNIPHVDDANAESGLCIASCVVGGRDSSTISIAAYCNNNIPHNSPGRITQSFICGNNIVKLSSNESTANEDLSEQHYDFIEVAAPIIFLEPLNVLLRSDVPKSIKSPAIAQIYSDKKTKIPPIGSAIECVFWKCSCPECCEEMETLVENVLEENGEKDSYKSSSEISRSIDDEECGCCDDTVDPNELDYYNSLLFGKDLGEKLLSEQVSDLNTIETNNNYNDVAFGKNGSPTRERFMLKLLFWNFISDSVSDVSNFGIPVTLEGGFVANEKWTTNYSAVTAPESVNAIAADSVNSDNNKIIALRKILAGQNIFDTPQLILPQFVSDSVEKIVNTIFFRLGITAVVIMKLNKETLSRKDLFPFWSDRRSRLVYNYSSTLCLAPQTLFLIDEVDGEINNILNTMLESDQKIKTDDENNTNQIIATNLTKLSTILTDRKLNYVSKFSQWSSPIPKIGLIKSSIASEAKNSFFSEIASIVTINNIPDPDITKTVWNQISIDELSQIFAGSDIAKSPYKKKIIVTEKQMETMTDTAFINLPKEGSAVQHRKIVEKNAIILHTLAVIECILRRTRTLDEPSERRVINEFNCLCDLN